MVLSITISVSERVKLVVELLLINGEDKAAQRVPKILERLE